MRLRRDARRIWHLIGVERRNYAIGLSSLGMVNVCDVLAPVFMAVAIDLTEAELTGGEAITPTLLRLVGLEASQFTIVGAIVLYLLLQVGANAFRFPMLMYVAVPSHRVGQRVRNALAGHMLRLSRPFYDRAKSGDLMSLTTNDVGAVRMMLGPGILVGADTLLIVVLVVLVLLTLSWQLTLLAMIPLPFIALVTNRLSREEYRRFEEVQEDIGKLTERARESFAGIRILQGYAREAYDRARFRDHSWRHYEKNLRLARVRASFMPTLDFMLGISTVLVLVVGAWQVLAGALSVGTFTAFLFLVGFVAGPMVGFGWSVTLFQRGRASLDRIDRFLAEPVEITAPVAPTPLVGRGNLEVRALTFSHAGPPPLRDGEVAPARAVHASGPALVDLSFVLPAGGTLGVIGPVGSGKSTLMQLLVRLYDPPPGTIFLDGVDIRDAALADLRHQVVLAPQESFLFGTTVQRNVSLSLLADDTQRESTVRAVGLACLRPEIDALPEGYDTMLGERGYSLSGGQRQRLAIARAIAADPRVLVLDDCLSAVDARTEEAILQNLREVFAGRSGIIVSHRVAAVRACDEILVLDAGRVVERGTHQQLLARNGWYAKIASSQSDHEEAA